MVMRRLRGVEGSKGVSARPEDVISLLYEGEVGANWAYANRTAARFFLLNAQKVLGRLGLPHTKAGPYFRQAEEVISQETKWYEQLPFDYACSHTQIYPAKIRQPKLFGHAATLIVGIELAAAHLAPHLNVYEELRILSAQYFVDRLTESRLKLWDDFYSELSARRRTDLFGPNSSVRSFRNLCTDAIGQRDESILAQLAAGYCVTKWVAENLVQFVNIHVPPELHVGPVLSSGDDAIETKLGVKNAAPSLLVSANMPVESPK